MYEYPDNPLSNLSEEIDALCRLLDKNSVIPFWMTREQGISKTVESIKELLDHIEKHGNSWAFEEKF